MKIRFLDSSRKPSGGMTSKNMFKTRFENLSNFPRPDSSRPKINMEPEEAQRKIKELDHELKRMNESNKELQQSQKNQENKAREQIAARLEDFRKNNYTGMPFHDIEAMEKILSDKSYLEQMIIFEQAAKHNLISPAELLNYFYHSTDMKTNLAVVENLDQYQDLSDEERKLCLDFLSDLAANYFSQEKINSFDKNKKLEMEIGLPDFKGLDEEYVEYNLTEENGAYEVFKSASFTHLANFGRSAEPYLIKLLENSWQSQGLIKQSIQQRPLESQKKDASERTEIENDPDLQEAHDENFYSNAYILTLLKKIGGEQSVDFSVEAIKKYTSLFSANYGRLLEILINNPDYAADKILLSIKELPEQNQSNVFRLVIVFTDLLSAEAARQKINEAITKEKDQSVIDNLEYARAFFTPNHDKIAIENLQKFYQEKIKFEDYSLNEKMLGKEIKLLEELINKDAKVLEMGCGAGRLIEKLIEDGYDVTGFDNVPRHTQITKEKIEKLGKPANVFGGDWHRNAIKDESFDTVYSLGRNILHDYSLPDQVQLFREAARILKKGGRFIFDIPDRGKGKYKLMVEGYKKEMEKRAIKNFRCGAIYDSPDGKNFAIRYAYSNEDIEQLATLAGFRIKEIQRIPLETGTDDENIYYVLEKAA